MKADLMDISELKAELETYHTASFGWALSCCGRNSVEAEEVVQIVYLKILEGKARYRGEASFKTWLFSVIRKTAASEHRRNMLRKLSLIAGSEQANQLTAPTEEPAELLERSETQMRFQRVLAKLPGRQREVLHLVFYEDLSLREAAEVLGISIGSARQHYERGKKRLRQYLEASGKAYGVVWRRKENPGAVS